MRSNNLLAGSSLGSCGTSSPQKALESGGRGEFLYLDVGGLVADFKMACKVEQRFDTADRFRFVHQWMAWVVQAL